MKDVFIIGAGASVPYGFPTGFGLLQRLKSFDINSPGIVELDGILSGIYGVKVSSQDIHQKSEVRSSINEIKAELLKVQNSCIVTVDQYLKNHLNNDKTQKVIKVLIAYLILKAEEDSFVNRFSTDINNCRHIGNIDWIQNLLTRIDLYGKNENKLLMYLHDTTFISFNYDRVLEFFLKNFLVCDRQYSEENALEIITSLNIFHINGSIGSLADIFYGDTKIKDYSKIIQNMRTVWEKPNEEDACVLNKAKLSIENADRIFSLGTSYIKDNNESIGLINEKFNKDGFKGTVLGLSKANIERLNSQLGFITTNEIDSRFRNVSAMDLIIDEYVL